MAKIDRYDGNLKAFASEQLGSERTLFGQLTSANDLTSQITAEFLRGWGIVGPSDQPSLQDFNAAMYTNGQLIAYLHQMGVAEYNPLQEYHIGSITNLSGVLYKSLTDDNIGNDPSSSPSDWKEAWPTQVLPPKYFSGFTMSNNVGSPTTTVDVAAGSARNLLDTLDIRLTSTISGILQTSGAWAAGSGNNKLDAGARANNQTYHVFAIRRTSDGAGDILFSLSPTVPTMPSGYSGFRRIGSVLTDSSGLIKSFVQDGDNFLLKNPTQDVSAAGVAAGNVFYAVSVPTGINVTAIVQGSALSSGGSATFHINTPGQDDAPGLSCATAVSPVASQFVAFGRVYIRTDTSARIQLNSSIAGNTYRLGSYGWVDRRDA